MPIEKEILFAANRFFSENDILISKLWDLISDKTSDYKGVDTRFSLAYSFMMGFGRYQYIKELGIYDFVIFDEGLLHKLCNVITEEDLLNLDAILELFPKPRGVILFNPSTEVIVERATKRVSIMYKHASKVEIEAETLRKAGNASRVARKLQESYGVRLLEIDSSLNSTLNLNKIYAFIRSLE